MPWDYTLLKRLLADERLPAMIVDLDILEQNADRLAAVAKKHGKKLRVASKSVRVPFLLRLLSESLGDSCGGLMCFSPAEAHFLAGQGFDDLLVAYPSVQPDDLALAWEMTQAGTDVTLMIDAPEHVERLEAFFGKQESGKPVQVCLDVDMSWRPVSLHIGVQRSSIRDLAGFAAMVARVQDAAHLKLHGVMGYEAQIAGLGDSSPFTPSLNPFKRLIRNRSVRDVSKKRGELARWLEENEVSLALFNGGGTGSISTTAKEPWITEVTAGSGFLQSHLFDYYQENLNRPAFCFGLQVTRIPEKGVVTCQSGGFIASGEAGPDKQPLPFLPVGLRATRMEGFGEVQTPLRVPPGEILRPGDPVFFRPAKAGEIAERFNEYLLKRGDRIVERVPTYRGLGHCFY
jgi:D-serine deaminase-like pyridoxal phosphate-dependent protein